MKRIYLKIIDVDSLDTTELSNDVEATHCLDVLEKDYKEAVKFIDKYLHNIQMYLPEQPEEIEFGEA
jgi:DNA-binding ferritin-like protein (Dps family)|tara:strand:+ start:806 stop:1006 length:201 start_codon:yes stop_codon:yes gene_type:complete